MPYPAGHRERIRKKIVESARRLFNRSGFESVSVDSIMAHAGLTRGGFYSYFDSKSDTTGGYTNFRGPLGYITIEHAL